MKTNVSTFSAALLDIIILGIFTGSLAASPERDANS